MKPTNSRICGRVSLEHMKRVRAFALACLLLACTGGGSEPEGVPFGCQDPGGPCYVCYPERPGFPQKDPEEWTESDRGKYCDLVPRDAYSER